MSSQTEKFRDCEDERVQILMARRDIEHEIDGHLRAVVALKTRLNALTRTCRLPSELLSKILACAARDAFHSDASNNYYSPFRWIRLAHVCQHWRTAAYSTPRFWSYLRITDTNVFSELIPLSKDAPLHVGVTSKWQYPSIAMAPKIWLASLGLLQQHTHRLQELHIRVPPKIARALYEMIQTRLEILDTLVLTAEPAYESSGSSQSGESTSATVDELPQGSSTWHAPRLRRLVLRGIAVRWSEPIFSSPSLTTLIVNWPANIRSASPAKQASHFDELLSALGAAAARLEVLELKGAVPGRGTTVAGVEELPPPSRTIILNSLRMLCLAGHTIDCANLLDHLVLPTGVSIDVEVHGDLGVEHIMHYLASHFSSVEPLLKVYIQDTRFSVIVSGWLHFATPSHESSRDAQCMRLMYFDATPSSASREPNTVRRIMNGSESLFYKVQKLVVGETLMVGTLEWACMFVRFPSLTTLVLGCHATGEFFTALTLAPTLKSGKPHVQLPTLSVLELTHFGLNYTTLTGGRRPGDPGSPSPFDHLVDWAIFRCNYSHPVDEVRLKRCERVSSDDVKRLEEVVVNVQWDGSGRDDPYGDADYDSDFFGDEDGGYGFVY